MAHELAASLQTYDTAGGVRPSRSAAKGMWKAVSSATSLSLLVGAVIYGVALGSSGPLVSPVAVAAAPAANAVAPVTADAPGAGVVARDAGGRIDARNARDGRGRGRGGD
ncbi:hypothetical protein [Microbacterium deminutum]|uniref:Uncharacterized protein n=1 Tax=Microbacterium deminutum TaxID=344164 RepID=A0ABP5CDF7_9MICO